MEKQDMDSHASNFNDDKPIFIIDKFGKIIDVNEAFCEQSGLAKKEILGMSIVSILIPAKLLTGIAYS